MPPLRAIPTRFAGVTFRSRLEADWAYHLSSLGVSWSYEPEGVQLPSGARYLPDFWLPGANAWLEVKGPGVPGLNKTDELRDAVSEPNCWGDLTLTQAVVIGMPAIGDKATFRVACRYCRGWVKSGWDGWTDKSGAAIEQCRSCDFRGFVTHDPMSCGMDSRCWVCDDKTYPLDPQLQPDRFWRLPRNPRDRQARAELERLFNGKAAS